jgi:hemerythrin-like domain-containing protein
MPVQIGQTSPEMKIDPLGLLSDCHRRVEMFLGVLKAAAALNGRQLLDDERRSLDNALRYFREAAPKHTADEEESLFPRMREAGLPEAQSALAELEKLEADHRWADPLHARVEELGQKWLSAGKLEVNDATAFNEAVAQLCAMYARHIEVEEKVVFPAASRCLPKDEQHRIGLEMTARRQK